VWHIWGRRELHTGFWWGVLREIDHFGDPGVDGRIILKCIFNSLDEGHGLDRSGSGQCQVTGACEYGNGRSGSIKWGELLD
jgi:hypothetical protein